MTPTTLSQAEYSKSCAHGMEFLSDTLGELLSEEVEETKEPFGNFEFTIHHVGLMGLKLILDRGQLRIDVQGVYGSAPDRWYPIEIVLIAASLLDEQTYLNSPIPPDPKAFGPSNAARLRWLEAHFDILNAAVNSSAYDSDIESAELRIHRHLKGANK